MVKELYQWMLSFKLNVKYSFVKSEIQMKIMIVTSSSDSFSPRSSITLLSSSADINLYLMINHLMLNGSWWKSTRNFVLTYPSELESNTNTSANTIAIPYTNTNEDGLFSTYPSEFASNTEKTSLIFSLAFSLLKEGYTQIGRTKLVWNNVCST